MRTTQIIKKEIESLKQIKSGLNRFLASYESKECLGRRSIAKFSLERVKNKLSELYIELAPLEEERILVMSNSPRVKINRIVDLKIKEYENWMH